MNDFFVNEITTSNHLAIWKRNLKLKNYYNYWIFELLYTLLKYFDSLDNFLKFQVFFGFPIFYKVST